MFKLLHYDGEEWRNTPRGGKTFFVCFSSFPKSYVNFISFFFLCTFSWEVEFQDMDFESSRFIFEVDQWLMSDDHITTQDICYYN